MRSDIIHKITKLADIEIGSKYKVELRIPFEYGWIERVKVSFFTFDRRNAYSMKHIKNEKEYAYFEVTVDLETQAIYHYYFSFEANRRFQYAKKKNITGETSITDEECWKLSVGFDAPDWAKGAVMYHIFVDRYRKSKDKKMEPMPNRTIHQNWYEPPVLGPDENGLWNIDFHGGDLKGIEETIKYLKSLCVTIIYLSPIVRSQSTHRYDAADYEEVDPYAGTNDGLKSLCDAAHRNSMKVILDGVFNHTGNDSKYFNEYGTFDTLGAYQSTESPYYNFYKRIWNQGKRDFSFWWGMKNLPECDGNSPEWRNYILGEGGIIDQWFALGIDGLRLDVADELTDSFIEGINQAVKRNKPDGLIIGEVWKNPMRMNRTYISSGKGMHSVMNYVLADSLIRYYKYTDIWKLETSLKEILTEYPGPTIQTLMNFTSTHDISRAIEIMGCNVFQQYGEWAWNLLPEKDNIEWIKNHHMTHTEYKYGKKMLKSYVFALTFLPGMLDIFYGDEIGMQGIGNLENRGPYTWNHRDKDLLKFFRSMGKIRKDYTFLKTAEMESRNINAKQFVFERIGEDEKVLVMVSRTHHESEVVLPEEYKDAKVIAKIKGSDKEILSPYGAVAVLKSKKQ